MSLHVRIEPERGGCPLSTTRSHHAASFALLLATLAVLFGTLASGVSSAAVAGLHTDLVGAVAVSQQASPGQRRETSVHIAPGVTWPAPSWIVPLDGPAGPGYVAQSSPTVASYRGETVVAVGAENGELYVVNAATGAELPGWPRRLAAGPGQSVAIESSPTIAWLDGPHEPPSIIASSGSTWVKSDVGEVEAFALSGKELWDFRIGAVPGTAIGVISSAAVGDVLGNGQEQVVFGSWNHDIYVLNAAGHQVGFAYDNADTIWSSPALYKLPGETGDSVFLGSDASGRSYDGTRRCFGGFIAEYRWSSKAQNPDTLAIGPGLDRVWFDCMNQSIWSSPSIGMLGGRLTLVVGTSWYEQPFPSDTSYVFAFDAVTGKLLWRAPTAGPAAGSPAIGVINNTGAPSVVDTSWICDGASEKDCFSSNRSMVYAWNARGGLEWSETLLGPTDISSPVLVPLGDHDWSDVLVGSPNGLYPLAGSSGQFLFGTNGSNPYAAIDPGCRVFNSAAVANIASKSAAPDWRAFEACGGPQAFHQAGELVSYKLPTPVGAVAAWAMFRASPEHEGVSYSTMPGRAYAVPGISGLVPGLKAVDESIRASIGR